MATAAAATAHNKAEVRGLNFWYRDFQALKQISLPIVEREVTALIGPSGCGKSTFLRCFNRMHDLYPSNRYEGEILLYPEGINIVSPKTDPLLPRLRIAVSAFSFKILDDLAQITLAPTTTVPNNPAVEDDQLKLYVDVEVGP